MKHYRIITQNGKHYVQEGEQIPAFFFGEPPFNWKTLESFHTMLEAQQFISFKQGCPSSGIFRNHWETHP